MEAYQKQQLEAVCFCYDYLKQQGLLRGFACIQETRAYTESFLPKAVDAEAIEKRGELPMTGTWVGVLYIRRVPPRTVILRCYITHWKNQTDRLTAC